MELKASQLFGVPLSLLPLPNGGQEYPIGELLDNQAPTVNDPVVSDDPNDTSTDHAQATSGSDGAVDADGPVGSHGPNDTSMDHAQATSGSDGAVDAEPPLVISGTEDTIEADEVMDHQDIVLPDIPGPQSHDNVESEHSSSETDQQDDSPKVTLADFHALSLKDLRAFAKHVGVSGAGGKALLVERIASAPQPTNLADQWVRFKPWWTLTE